MERMVDTHVSHNMYDDKDAWRVAVRSAWLASRRFDAALSNETVENDDNDHFRRCWRRQDCKSCLGVSACSWCPFVSPMSCLNRRAMYFIQGTDGEQAR